MPTVEDFDKYRFYQCVRTLKNSYQCERVLTPDYKILKDSILLPVNQNFPISLDNYTLHSQLVPKSVIIGPINVKTTG